MAECTISRCSQERRIFRKELHKWSKEILYTLGLERLAEELMGARKWKILIQPFTDLESNNPADWYPEDTCYFCSAKKQPPYDPASGIIPTIDGYSSLRIDTDEHSTSSDQGNISGSFTSCASALSPWHIAALSSQGVSCSPPPPLDQPLDLSVNSMRLPPNDLAICSSKKHSSLMNYIDENDSGTNSVLKVPQIPLKPGHRRRLDVNSKRSYTEEELQAALRDIQSGKLGTRRAAVIYGIPRSTLRNKVYKLANESKSRAHCRATHTSGISAKKEQIKNLKANDELEVPVYESASNKQNIASASDSLRLLLKQTITQKFNSSKGTEKSSDTGIDFPQTSDDDAMKEFQMLSSLECQQALAPVLSHVFSDIQHLALVKTKENNCSSQSLSALKDDLKLPLLPDLIRRLAEERIELERDTHKDSEVTDPDGFTENSGAPSNVILKVPSFKPAKSPPINDEVDNPLVPALSSSSPPPGTSSHTLSGNKGIAVSLKELIARSISTKVNCQRKDKAIDEEPSVDYSITQANSDSPPCNMSWTVENPSKDGKESALSTINNSSNSSDSSKSEKRTRPKRGRYRNYDRDNLARAVRAVQKGEMSVHRAGTFYGVPHSTLEYKVKERHLLRPRKRDALSNSLVVDTTDSALKTNNSFSIENNVSVKNLKINLNQFAVESSNGLSTDVEQPHRPSMGSYPSPLSLWQSMPFLSLDFSQLGSNNFFASQMMRKLQENARLHEETQKREKQKSQDFGILESLIKSTLERSVSPESKSTLILSSDNTPMLSDCKRMDDMNEK